MTFIGATSMGIVWRSSPPRFLVRFDARILILREHGNTYHASGWYYIDGERTVLDPQDFGPYQFRDVEENFINCMMMAKPETERLNAA